MDAAVPKAEKSLDDDQSGAKSSPDADATAENQTMEENTALTQIETPQTGDDIDEEQQEKPSSMRFSSIHM